MTVELIIIAPEAQHDVDEVPEYILKSSDSDERFVITKDNKPIAALISIEDFQFIEQKQKGLASVVGKWKDFDEIEDILADISSMREKGGTGCIFLTQIQTKPA